MPIGIHFKEKPFTNVELKIQKGDIFYAFTDGFQDQFGGKSGRKFLSKNLKELLFANHTLSMNEQKKVLEKTIDD
jgi:serine phosphatase RsbU (regulator of sigma subunit)